MPWSWAWPPSSCCPRSAKDVTVDGLMVSYEAVIARVGEARLKLVLYDIPPIAQVPMPLPQIERLREHHPAMVVGIKDGGGDFAHMAELTQRFPGLAVLAGGDPLMLPLLREGVPAASPPPPIWPPASWRPSTRAGASPAARPRSRRPGRGSPSCGRWSRAGRRWPP
jgi:Dihydrodipicolinate synthetase family